MLPNFRTYQLSVQFYRACAQVKLPFHLKEQLQRAAASISLNLAEGYAKPTKKDQRRFFFIAFGSLRECQAVLDLAGIAGDSVTLADQIGACLYKLTRS